MELNIIWVRFLLLELYFLEHMKFLKKWKLSKLKMINNYYNGGSHPMGKVGINKRIDLFTIIGFDDIQSDKSLSYEVVVK